MNKETWVIFIFWLLMLVTLGLFSGCKQHEQMVPPAPAEQVVETVTRVEYIHDTIYVILPIIKESVRVKDSVSYLENDYAESRAAVDTLGTLSHSLSTKATPIATEVDVKIVTRDSVVYRDVIREVERDYTAWETVRLKAFWWLVAAVVAAGIYIIGYVKKQI